MAVVEAMIGNAAVAAGLAFLALAAGYVCRCPVLRHAAWLIVLLKLVTPPLFGAPLHVLPPSWSPPAEQMTSSASVLFSPVAESRSILPIAVAQGGTRERPTSVVEWLMAVWVAGSIGWFVWQGRKILRFRRLVARAEDAPPEVSEAAKRLALALGIACPPHVKLMTGTGSPMLWGWGRGVVVLFPRDLLVRLSTEARDTLLAHELAHYLRRDHWVRFLEFAATGLYWWHPAVWIARREIEWAEEECCDAWVVGELAASPRSYAEALLATVDYDAELRRPCLPTAACAAHRSARLLQGRLIGIINAGRPRRIPGARAIRVLIFAALLTRPVLLASTSELVESAADTAINERKPRVKSDAARKAPPRQAAARPWAATTAPGGLSVEARDKEVLLRHSDGSSFVLGPGRPLALSFAPGGQRLATAGPGSLVRLWDERGSQKAEAQVGAAARSIAYMPDGSRLLVLDANGDIFVLGTQTLEPLARWSVGEPANSIACSPDGATVAVSFGSWLSEAGRVECWSITDRRRVATFTASGPVGAARFTPDGKTLIIGRWNGTIAWRSLFDGNLMAERELSKELVATAAFCPESGTLPLVPPLEIAPPPVPIVLPQPSLEFLQGTSMLPER